jgi:hypothetical protein
VARRLHKIRRLLASVVILCLLVVLVFVGVHTPPVRRYVTRQVISLLKQHQIDLNTDQLGYNLFNASINVPNVRVRSSRLIDASFCHGRTFSNHFQAASVAARPLGGRVSVGQAF